MNEELESKVKSFVKSISEIYTRADGSPLSRDSIFTMAYEYYLSQGYIAKAQILLRLAWEEGYYYNPICLRFLEDI